MDRTGGPSRDDAAWTGPEFHLREKEGEKEIRGEEERSERGGVPRGCCVRVKKKPAK